MAKRTKDQNTLYFGGWNVRCDVCGFKFKNCDIEKRWDGLAVAYVCKDDWEPRHPSDLFRAPYEDPSVPYTRPDTIEVGGVDINGNTFPPSSPTITNVTVTIV